MSAFSSRFLGYRIGVVCLFLFTVLFLAGFSSPFWFEDTRNSWTSSLFRGSGVIVTKKTIGLWMFCETSDKTGETLCHAITGEIKAWLHGVRAQECVSLLLLVAACVYAVAVNCCRSIPGPRSRALEALVAVAGLNGLTGTVVYVVMTKHDHWLFDHLSFSWAFYLTAVVSAAVVAVAVLIAISNKVRDVTTPTTANDTTVPPAYVLQPINNGYPRQPAAVFSQTHHLHNQAVSGQVRSLQYQPSGMQDEPPPYFSAVSGQVWSQNQPSGMLNGPPLLHTSGQAGQPVSRQTGPPPQAGYTVTRQNEPLSQAGSTVSRQNGPPPQAGNSAFSQSGYLLRADYSVSGENASYPNYAGDRNNQSGHFNPSTNTTCETSPGDWERLKPSAPPL